MNGLSVENVLTILYNDKDMWQKCNGDIGVAGMLIESIVQGNGCTTCGQKVIDWAKEIGAIRKH